MHTVDVTELSRDELEETVLKLAGQVREAESMRKHQAARINVLQEQVDSLDSKFLLIRNFMNQ